MDTALPQKFPFILDKNLAKANCTENRVCTSCDTVVLGLCLCHNPSDHYCLQALLLRLAAVQIERIVCLVREYISRVESLATHARVLSAHRALFCGYPLDVRVTAEGSNIHFFLTVRSNELVYKLNLAIAFFVIEYYLKYLSGIIFFNISCYRISLKIPIRPIEKLNPDRRCQLTVCEDRFMSLLICED